MHLFAPCGVIFFSVCCSPGKWVKAQCRRALALNDGKQWVLSGDYGDNKFLQPTFVCSVNNPSCSCRCVSQED